MEDAVTFQSWVLSPWTDVQELQWLSARAFGFARSRVLVPSHCHSTVSGRFRASGPKAGSCNYRPAFLTACPGVLLCLLRKSPWLNQLFLAGTNKL